MSKLKSLPAAEQKILFEALDKKRKPAKITTYSSMYGIGAPKLARDTGKTVIEAERLLEAYWEMNWAIKEVVDRAEVKTFGGQMWVKNPLNGFWYSLRNKKDIWSTLNQGTGAYLFDRWLHEVRKRRDQLTAQFHDEGIWEIDLDKQEEMEDLLQEAITAVNDSVELNVTLKVDVKFGQRYDQIH